MVDKLPDGVVGPDGLLVRCALPMANMQIRVASLTNQKAGFCAGVTTRGPDALNLFRDGGVSRFRVAQSPLPKSQPRDKNLG